MRRRLIRIGIVVLAINLAMAALAVLLRRALPSRGDEDSEELALVAAGTGISLRSRARSFRGGSARAIMGGIDLDLRGATLDPAGARLELHALMGGIQATVPDTWRLKRESAQAMMGGVDLPHAEETDGTGGPALVIAARVDLGGIEVITRPVEPENAVSQPSGRASRTSWPHS